MWGILWTSQSWIIYRIAISILTQLIVTGVHSNRVSGRWPSKNSCHRSARSWNTTGSSTKKVIRSGTSKGTGSITTFVSSVFASLNMCSMRSGHIHSFQTFITLDDIKFHLFAIPYRSLPFMRIVFQNSALMLWWLKQTIRKLPDERIYPPLYHNDWWIHIHFSHWTTSLPQWYALLSR